MISRCLSAAGIRFSQHPLPTGELAVPYGSVTGRGQTPLGLSCSACVRCERLRCLLYAGAYGVRTGAFEIPFSRMTRDCRIVHVSAAWLDDASDEGSHMFTLPFFALPWVRLWLPLPLGFWPRLHTPPLPAAHARSATGLHTGQDSLWESLTSCDFRSHSNQATTSVW